MDLKGVEWVEEFESRLGRECMCVRWVERGIIISVSVSTDIFGCIDTLHRIVLQEVSENLYMSITIIIWFLSSAALNIPSSAYLYSSTYIQASTNQFPSIFSSVYSFFFLYFFLLNSQLYYQVSKAAVAAGSKKERIYAPNVLIQEA